MKKKQVKIGTISLNINTDDFNYGAMLHSWAFQKYLMKNKNYYVEIIDYVTPHLEKLDYSRPVISNLKAKRRLSAAKDAVFYFPYKQRYKKFQKFIKNHMITSKEKYTQKKLNDAKLDYDILVCESDVIWYPGCFKGNYDPSFFLALDSMKGKKRIAYSPSMSSLKYVEKKKDELKELLTNLDHISCRETYEIDVLQELTDKKVTHVMDPVFLLEPEDYDEITGKRIIKDKYLLLYLPVNDNRELRKSAKKYAKEHGLKILEISTKLYPNFIGQKTLTHAGIEEFLSCIRNADMVFTNSFHAICFSVLFNKEFYAFTRHLNGKVEDICKTLGLMDRYLQDNKVKEDKKINYNKVNKKVVELRKKSQDWINNAIEN